MTMNSTKTIIRDNLITANQLNHLPEPVRRYLTHAGIIGTPWIETVRLRYTGKFRTGADKPWMGITADQVYRTDPPAFHWKARLSMMGLPLLSGSDTYKNGHGHMFGRLAGLFTIFDARGPEMDQGTMVRYLQEIIWFPTAFLGDNITWKAVSEHAADVTFHDGGRSVSARLYVDDEGRLLTFKAERYTEKEGSFAMRMWTTPMTEYGLRGGLNLPVRGQAVWHMPEGDLTYADLTLGKVEYNQQIPAF
jgi:hypothetical protein